MKPVSENVLILAKNLSTVGSDGAILRSVRSRFDSVTIFAYDRFSRGEGLGIDLLNGVIKVSPSKIFKKLAGRVAYPVLLVWRLIFFKFRSEFDCVVCGSIELAFISEVLSIRGRRKFYLISDLSGFHLKKRSRWFVLLIESYCLKRNWLPVVTSPGFFSEHLSRSLGYEGNCYMVNNYPAQTDWAMSLVDNIELDFPVSIAWFGYLRCSKSLEVLVSLVKCKTSNFRLMMAGSIADIPENLVTSALSTENISYSGFYVESALPALYAQCTYVWCCDLSLGANSEALLPNRLYHAIAAGKPVIANKGSWCAKVVSAYGIGVIIDEMDASALRELLLSAQPQYPYFQDNCRKLQVKVNMRIGCWEDILMGQGLLIDQRILSGLIFD